MEVRSQLHAPATLSTGEKPLVVKCPSKERRNYETNIMPSKSSKKRERLYPFIADLGKTKKMAPV
jgi:hypothetical protein